MSKSALGNSYALFLGMIILLSCQKSSNDSITEDYKTFNLNQQQGWKSKRITQFVSNINYTATEVPLKYYLLKNLGDNPKKMDSIYNANITERIIEIEFQHANKSDLLLEEYTNKSYEEAVKYLAFTIKKDFKIITTSNDTINCSGVHFERNFKVAPFKRALLYFNNINQKDNIKLIYQDQLFGNGTIKFNFNDTPIKL